MRTGSISLKNEQATVLFAWRMAFTRLETLIETLANGSAREFASIAERFTAVDQHLEAVDEKLTAIEGSIEAFSHGVDNEVEERHLLAERVLKLETAA